jgi:hypothetical protein
MSVTTPLSMPRAKGLLHRAIVQSGTAHNVTAPSTAERIGRRLAEKMGVETTRKAVATVGGGGSGRPMGGDTIRLRYAGPGNRAAAWAIPAAIARHRETVLRETWQRAILFSPRAFPGPTRGIVRAVYGWHATFMRPT